MPLRTLLPANRSALLPWLIWCQWRTASAASSVAGGGSFAWTGTPSLLAAVQSQGSPEATVLATTGGNTHQLVVEFAAMPQAAGASLKYVRFMVRRRRDVGGNMVDFHVYLVKAGTVLTAVDKKLATNWVAGANSETVYYTFTDADLATLGVTASDVASGTIGIAIQGQASSTTTAYVDQVRMDMAYSPMAEADLDYCQLPGNISMPSPWLRIYTWSPAVPNTDTIMGIEVDITAWTDDPNAAGGDPILTTAWATQIGAGAERGTSTPVVGTPTVTPELPGTVTEEVEAQPGGDGPLNGVLPPPPTGYYYPLEVALSLDGVNPIGETWVVFTTTTVQMFTCGSPTYLWAKPGGWVPSNFSGTFSVLVRRPNTPTAVLSQYVTTARVRVTTISQEGTLIMPVRQTLTEHVLLGVESTPGTIASSFKRMRALNYRTRPNVNVKKFRPQGEKMQAVVVPTREWGSGSISGLADYNELPVVLEAIIGAGVHSGTGVASQRNIHQYNLENRKRSTIKTYSVQRGETTTRAQQHLYLVHTGLQIQINTQDCQVSGAWFAQKMTDGITMAAGANEVQTMTITGTPTGGTYKLAFRGAETAAIQFNANAAAITSALEALPSIGAGNVVVTGTGPFTITFGGTLAGENMPMVYLANNSLTGGTTPTVTVVQATKGGWSEYGTELQPILPQHINVYLADTEAGLAAGKLDKTVGVAATGFDIADRHTPFWTLDRDTATTFTDTTEMDPKFKANLTVGANSTGMALLNSIRNGATKWLMIEAVGPMIGATSDPHKMIWKGCVKVDDTADFGDEDGRVIYPWSLEWVEGPNGEVPTLTIENGVVSY